MVSESSRGLPNRSARPAAAGRVRERRRPAHQPPARAAAAPSCRSGGIRATSSHAVETSRERSAAGRPLAVGEHTGIARMQRARRGEGASLAATTGAQRIAQSLGMQPVEPTGRLGLSAGGRPEASGDGVLGMRGSPRSRQARSTRDPGIGGNYQVFVDVPQPPSVRARRRFEPCKPCPGELDFVAAQPDSERHSGWGDRRAHPTPVVRGWAARNSHAGAPCWDSKATGCVVGDGAWARTGMSSRVPIRNRRCRS